MKQQQNFLIFKDHYFVKKRKIVQIQVLSTHAFFITWLGSVFYLKMRRCYSYLPFQKKTKKTKANKQTNTTNESKCEKEFLLYINIDSQRLRKFFITP